jgi:hypothetical protein
MLNDRYSDDAASQCPTTAWRRVLVSQAPAERFVTARLCSILKIFVSAVCPLPSKDITAKRRGVQDLVEARKDSS